MPHEQTIYALLYCRVSSLRQKDEGSGLESQEFRCKERARQKGYTYERTFVDSFSGGGDFMKRPAMRELLAYLDLNPDKRCVVIFDDLKRFARDVIFHWKLRREFQARQTLVECLNFNFDETPEGEFIETILAAQGELERKQNRRQVMQKQKARLEAGCWPFFPPPGYRHAKDATHGKLLVQVEPEATIIRQALEGFASGRFVEQRDVQRFLARRGFNSGRPVYVTAVRRLLERDLYAGYIAYGPWRVSRRKGRHDPLISPVVYDKIQERLRGTVRTFVRKNANNDFPLRGFVLCARCRAPFAPSWSRGRSARYAYYRCKTASCPERHRHVSRSVIEKRFHHLLRQMRPRPQTLALTKDICLRVWQEKVGNLDAAIERYQRELVEVTREITTLAERAARTQSDTVARVYERQVDELAARERALKEKLATIRPTSEKAFGTALDRVFDTLRKPLAEWKSGRLADRRLLLKLLFSAPLVYDREEGFGTASFSLPYRVFELSQASRFRGVEIVRETWNQLETFILETYQQLCDRDSVDQASLAV